MGKIAMSMYWLLVIPRGRKTSCGVVDVKCPETAINSKVLYVIPKRKWYNTFGNTVGRETWYLRELSSDSD